MCERNSTQENQFMLKIVISRSSKKRASGQGPLATCLTEDKKRHCTALPPDLTPLQPNNYKKLILHWHQLQAKNTKIEEKINEHSGQQPVSHTKSK